MSTFIDKSDYDAHIRTYRLDQTTAFTDSLLDKAESRAIAYMTSHLSGRFDCQAIFAATGDDRDEAILGFAIDIALYYLWRLVAPKKVPNYVKEAYEDAKEWLIGVKEGEIIPQGLPVSTSENADTITYGSNPRRVNHV